VACVEAYLPTKWHLDPSNRLADDSQLCKSPYREWFRVLFALVLLRGDSEVCNVTDVIAGVTTPVSLVSTQCWDSLDRQ